MSKPQISWYVLEQIDEDFEFVPKYKHDMEESYTSGELVTLKVQVWNNRSGDEDVDDALNSRLIAYFKNYEDVSLLNLCKIKIEDNEAQSMVIDIDRAEFSIGTLFGRSNNGSDSNSDNYVEFEMQFGPIPSSARSELKSLILDLEYD